MRRRLTLSCLFNLRCGQFEEWLPGLNEPANYELPIPLEATPQPTIKIRKRDRDRAERIRLAGGPKPSLRERAVALAREKGEVRTCDLTDIGIPRCYLSRMCDEGLLIKIGYGIYRAADQEAA
ncbi:MAG: type IV toxin-antitoxin system AbiEi family antitoxin domain-containing protein [Rhizobiaceae bacterium]